jgi:polysaccharide export outer membrane protein
MERKSYSFGGEMVRTVFLHLLSILVITYITGCTPEVQTQPKSSIGDNQSGAGAISIYRIGVDDMVNVNVWRNPELTVTVPVRPDGKISMPLIGDVNAAGFTPEEVASDIRNKLQSFVRDPNVTLMITGLQSHEYLARVRVTGAVNTPSSLNYRQGMTVLDAVLAAGGINDFASPDSTKLYRKVDGKTKVIGIELGEILNDGNLDTNFDLRPGDILTIPERLF